MANPTSSAVGLAEVPDKLQLYAHGLVVADPLGMVSQANSAAELAKMEVPSARRCLTTRTFWKR